MRQRWILVLVLLGSIGLLEACKSCNLGKCGFAWYPTQLISVSTGSPGTPANGVSGPATASLDGRFIAFGSMATNLVTPATDNTYHIYLRDTCTGTTAPAGCQPKTVLVSVAKNGQAPTVCFGAPDINARPSISGDGRYVAFESSLCDLGLTTNNSVWQVYLRDTCTGPNGPATVTGCTAATYIVTNGSLPSRQPSISSDGRYVALKSNVSLAPDGQGNPASGPQIFVADVSQCLPGPSFSCGANIKLVSQDASGVQANSLPWQSGWNDEPQISSDGRFVVFTSNNTNLGAGGSLTPMQVLVADSCQSAGQLVSGCQVRAYGPFSTNQAGTLANIDARTPSVSSGGRYVAFASQATNVLAGVPSGISQIYFVDNCGLPTPQAGCSSTRKLVSTTLDGKPGNQSSEVPWIAPNGQGVVFKSRATNFVPQATNNVTNIYVSSTCPTSASGCIVGGVALGTADCKPPNGPSKLPVFTPDGKLLVFTSDATNLLPNGVSGVYVGQTGP